MIGLQRSMGGYEVYTPWSYQAKIPVSSVETYGLSTEVGYAGGNQSVLGGSGWSLRVQLSDNGQIHHPTPGSNLMFSPPWMRSP